MAGISDCGYVMRFPGFPDCLDGVYAKVSPAKRIFDFTPSDPAGGSDLSMVDLFRVDLHSYPHDPLGAALGAFPGIAGIPG